MPEWRRTNLSAVPFSYRPVSREHIYSLGHKDNEVVYTFVGSVPSFAISPWEHFERSSFRRYTTSPPPSFFLIAQCVPASEMSAPFHVTFRAVGFPLVSREVRTFVRGSIYFLRGLSLLLGWEALDVS